MKKNGHSRRNFIRVSSAAAASVFIPGSGFFRCTNTVLEPAIDSLPFTFLSKLDVPEEEGGFYIEFVDGKGYRPTGLDINTWTLQFVWRRNGQVEHTAQLSYDDIASLFPAKEVSLCHTFQCVGNTPGGALVSTGVFTGVKLREYLNHLHTFDPINYKRVNFRCYDGYGSNHRIDKVMYNDDAPVFLIYKFNGQPLNRTDDETLAHGFPVRILAQDMMGMKSPKALLEIEITDDDTVTGHWETMRISKDYPNVTWADLPDTRPNSRIISPLNYQQVGGSSISVQGFAWSGTDPVYRVQVGLIEEISESFTVKWVDAEIAPPPNLDMINVYGAGSPEVIDAVTHLGSQQWPQPFVWCQWSAAVPIPSGWKKGILLARAISRPVGVTTDDQDEPQPLLEIGSDIADGNNGMHAVNVRFS